MTNRHLIIYIVISLVSLLLAGRANAQATGSDTCLRMNLVGLGVADVLDTYLSPEHYTGTSLRFVTFNSQPTGSRGTWAKHALAEGELLSLSNRAGTGNELGANFRFQMAWKHNWMATENLRVRLGGAGDLSLGFIYNTRNQNNPAQAYATLSAGLAAGASYGFSLLSQTMTLDYETYLPLLGVAFSPNYGQSYYEIFTRGNYDHNVVLLALGGMPSLRQQLTLGLRMLGLPIRVGYLGDYQQFRANNLKRHQYVHSFVVGLTLSNRSRHLHDKPSPAY